LLDVEDLTMSRQCGILKSKSKAILVTCRGGLYGCEMLRIPELTARYWLLVAVLTDQFVPHRKHTPSP
jgi:hypothetical protein